MIRFFNPGLAYRNIKDEVDSEMQRVLSAGDLILRSDVEKFERTLAEYVGTKYAVGLNSCTDALYLALRALKIGPGDEVLVPSRTFVATAQVVVQVGATPVFYDLDGALTYGEKVKAIIPVHIEGAFDNNFGHILETAKEKGWHIIEDAAQALGASMQKEDEYTGEIIEQGMAGSFGDAGCFSFYPAKILGAYGDAGALVTNNEEIYKYVKDCRNHFKDDARDWGVNSRLDNLQATVLNVRFKHLPKMLERRKEIAEMYQDGLMGILELPWHTEGRVWQDYIVNTKKRDALYEYLKENGIETLKNNYPFPIKKLPLAQAYEDETLRLPCNELLTNEEVGEVIEQVKQFFHKEG